MTTVSELVTDFDDSDVEILKLLTARLARPTGPDEEDRWPSRVQAFWRGLCVDLDEEMCRRKRMVAALDAMAEDDGDGALVSDDTEDLSDWRDTDEAA
jgi:hypothetical protein